MSTKKASPPLPAEQLALYDKLIATHPDIERKGVSLPYTSFNGHMFTFMSKAGVVCIRLPTAEREAFLKKYKTGLFEAYGTTMKEYVVVPEKLQKNTKALQPYLTISFEYVKRLKPKTQKKPKAA